MVSFSVFQELISQIQNEKEIYCMLIVKFPFYVKLQIFTNPLVFFFFPRFCEEISVNSVWSECWWKFWIFSRNTLNEWMSTFFFVFSLECLRLSSVFVCLCCRSVVVPVKKTSPGSLAVNTMGSSSSSSSTSAGLTAGSSPNTVAAAAANPKSMINTTGRSNTRSLSTAEFHTQPGNCFIVIFSFLEM